MHSLPQAFKEAGWVACGVGKTFHDDTIMSPPDYDAPLSWSPECGDYFVAPRDACPPGVALCSVPGYKPADYEDSRVVRHAVAIHREAHRRRQAQVLQRRKTRNHK